MASLLSTIKVVAAAELAPSSATSNPGAKALEFFNAGEWTSAIESARRRSALLHAPMR